MHVLVTSEWKVIRTDFKISTKVYDKTTFKRQWYETPKIGISPGNVGLPLTEVDQDPSPTNYMDVKKGMRLIGFHLTSKFYTLVS